jgi:hypothetical protein
MKPTAFAHFERALGAEHRRKNEADIEAGIIPAPKPKKPATGRPRRSSLKPEEPRPRLNRNGKVEISFPVSPKFTAAAALTAARRGTTTQSVVEEWITTLAFAEVPENPAPREVLFTMHLTVGPDAFPADVFKDLCRFADEIGVSPERLAAGIVKQALAAGRFDPIPEPMVA